MTANAWESFVARLLMIGVNAVQGLIRIVLIVAIGWIVIKLMRASFNRVESWLIRAAERTELSPDAAFKRIRTLSGVLWTISCGLLWFIVALTSLSQIGVNIGPILAGAGFVGLAVGFGAQHLVRDLVAGFFLILENQIRVGDLAIINGTSGMVEAVTFRTVVLRDQAGVVYVFPNGMINTLANATLDWSAYVLDITLPFKVDTDRVVDIMRRIANEMKSESEYGPMMLEPIEILGVENFTDTNVTLKARIRTRPAQQHLVGREFRRRLKYALQREGVEFTASQAATAPKPPDATTPPA